jgi:hypothetical protein
MGLHVHTCLMGQNGSPAGGRQSIKLNSRQQSGPQVEENPVLQVKLGQRPP